MSEDNKKLTIHRDKDLGRGGFGSVYLGTWKKENQLVNVAVKRVLLNDSNQHEENNLKKLNHPNVVKLLDVLEDLDFK